MMAEVLQCDEVVLKRYTSEDVRWMYVLRANDFLYVGKKQAV